MATAAPSESETISLQAQAGSTMSTSAAVVLVTSHVVGRIDVVGQLSFATLVSYTGSEWDPVE